MYATSFPQTETHPAPSGRPRAVAVNLGVMRDFAERNAESAGNRTGPLKSTPLRQLAAVRRLAACMDYMQAHLHEPLRISTLSTMAGLSASRFFELFKHATGDTPLNWFIRARMKWAGELLEQSNHPIKQIAGQVGYEDQFYFSRLFKAVQGVPPSAYRQRKRSPAAAGCGGPVSNHPNASRSRQDQFMQMAGGK